VLITPAGLHVVLSRADSDDPLGALSPMTLGGINRGTEQRELIHN
jgi:hypothetical protein